MESAWRAVDGGLDDLAAVDLALLAADELFAGCDIPADWCQVDHVQEWEADFGPTDLHLLVLWCTYHHTFRHRADVQLIGDADNLAIQLPDGTIVPLPARGPTIKHAPASPPGPPPDPETGQRDLFADPAA